MLILNCVFMTRFDILPRLAHLILGVSLSTSFIPHPQTRFGRLILKEGRIQCGAIRQSHLPAQSSLPTTQLLPLIYLSSVSLRESHPIVWPFFAHLQLCFFVHNQLGDYSNQVINYRARRFFCHTFLTCTIRAAIAGLSDASFKTLHDPLQLRLQLFSPHPDIRSFNREQRHNETLGLQQIQTPTDC